MSLSGLGIITAIYLFHHVVFPISGQSPVNDFAINCGSSANSTAFDGREWIGDAASQFIASQQQGRPKSLSPSPIHRSPFFDPIPYFTARISRSQFSYIFQVTPGQKFIRLHFYPATYPGFDRSKAFFTVKAGPHILLRNFSASLTADALGVKYFFREFCVTVGEKQALTITFSPCPKSKSDGTYAFVNGIEIVSMPTGLYYTPRGDSGARVVGKDHRFYIEHTTALELLHRLNVGGRSILSLEDPNMYRVWFDDKNYLLQSSALPFATAARIKYASMHLPAAPTKLYQSTWSWSLGSTDQANQTYDFTWKLPVNLGFRYLVRLHFCELEPTITETRQREFSIFINNQMAEIDGDVLKWSGGNGVAVYRDYVTVMEGDKMEGNRDLIIALQHNSTTQIDAAVLKGIEVFKLANFDNSLAAANPLPAIRASTSLATELSYLVATICGSRNMIATFVVCLITILNIIVHQLNVWTGKMSIPSGGEDGLCRRFSLADIQLATNNFDDKLVVGVGGFGKVYKGLIDRGTKIVAVKRLNSQSKQGAHEFWTEIETLSKFRHINLVPLIGYCNEFQEMILVYQYMANGTLADHLYKTSSNGDHFAPLPWERRLQICIAASRGLDYLHTRRSGQHGIIHRDVKSSNILLDENWVAKISDFGLSKVDASSLSRTHISTNVKGTIGYLDPDYYLTRRLTRRTDVYAFGVVLLEVLCGRQPVDTRLEDEQQHSLVLWVQHCLRNGTLDQIVDSCVREQICPDCFKVFTEIANKCLHKKPNERPNMADVVGSLELALELQQRPMPSSSTEEEVINHDGWSFNESIGLYETDEEITGGVGQDCNLQPEDGTLQPVFGHYNSSGGKEIEGSAAGTISSEDPAAQGRFNKKNYKTSNTGGRRIWGWDSPWPRMRLPKLKTKQARPKEEVAILHEDEFEISTMVCLQYEFEAVRVATNNFSATNMLGHGGFGAVYKGRLPDGQIIAVKRLSRNSMQGETEFKNEVMLLAKLQHRNLVRLLGFCIKKTERLLIYEFMPNSSLDHFIFNPVKRSTLDWKSRYKTIVGIAKGLLYLHEDFRLRIIHRNLKASNVLLDAKMNPKISSFGMARVIVMDETQHNTQRIVGTFGYMAPEYAMHGIFSVKTDVFSYGVLVLEIISGQKYCNFRNEKNLDDLLSFAWKNWREGTASNLIDQTLRGGSSSMSEIMRCIHIGLLCGQENAADRPTMASVVLMLNSFSETLAVPSRPAYYMHSSIHPEMPSSREGDSEAGSPTNKSAHVSVNEASITELYPR